MPQELELSRQDGTVLVERRRGWGWGVVLLILGGFFTFGGLFCAVTGQHLPKMSSLATSLWALLLGLPQLPFGFFLTKNGEFFFFDGRGLRVEFFRLRMMHWFVEYPLSIIEGIDIERREDGYSVIIAIKGRPHVELAKQISSERAWQLASTVAEPAFLTIRER